MIVRCAECMFLFLSEGAKGLFPFNKGVWNIERAFQISWKKKAAIRKGGLNDYGIPKAWGIEWFGIARARGG